MRDKSLDEQVREIVAPFQIVCARPGKLLTCEACGSQVEYTYRKVCGHCFLQGKRPRCTSFS